jgi:uncharacterized membrane protein YphA (DoxX/SURF4 family)
MQETILSAGAAASASVELAPPRPWVAWVGRAAAFLLGGVLLFATLAKALDPEGFAQLLQDKGLTLGLPPMVAALLALALEGGLGLLLLLGVRRPWSLAVAGAVTLCFVALNGWEWWRAAHGVAPAAGCGCFGNLVQRTPAAAFWQDLALLLPLLLLACVGLPRGARALPPRRLGVVAVATAALVLVAWRAPALPLDDLATRLRPGVELPWVCAGVEPRVCLTDVVPELQSERTWVVLVDLRTAPTWIDELNRFATTDDHPPVVALTSATTDEVAAFGWRFGPTFEVREAPAALIRPLYRRLPRSFLSEGGRVLRTTPGLPSSGDVRGERPR